MISPILTAAVAILAYLATFPVRKLYINIRAARNSSIPYIVSPVGIFQTPWMILEPILLPILKRLPLRWTETWLPLSTMVEVWRSGHLPFKQMGSDTLIVVTMTGNILFTADADVIDQMLSTSRRHDFPKALEPYEVMNIYGPTLNASEDEGARRIRRVAGPIFNEDLHRHVWSYALDKTDKMLRTTCKFNGTRVGYLGNVASLCNNLTLAVMSNVCYGKKLEENAAVPEGHKLSYSQAIANILHHTFDILLIPRLLLRTLPTKTCRDASLAFSEWLRYMIAIRDEERRRQNDEKTQSQNLLGALVANEAKHAARNAKPAVGAASRALTSEEVMGNIYFFLLAGHETTGNAISTTMLLLALKQDVQASIYEELQNVFGEQLAHPERWSYEKDFPSLLNGLVGALMSETLRIWMAGPTTARIVKRPQQIIVGDMTVVIPKDTIIYPNFVAVQRNPKYWNLTAMDAQEKNLNCADANYTRSNTYDSWNPTRWLAESSFQKDKTNEDSATSIKTAQAGSWVAFSRGPRSCLGSRFAQTEYCAFISRIISAYHVELDQHGFRDAQHARENAIKAITTGVNITMSYKPAKGVPLKFTPRA